MKNIYFKKVSVPSKWMELKNIILSEVTQTQKDIYHMDSVFKYKTKKTSLQITIPENLDKKEDPKRDIHVSNLHDGQ